MDMKKAVVFNNKEDTIKSRGFVTIATGKQKYYDLAQGLLHSYRANGNSTIPFTLLCDKDCPVAREFDSFMLIQDPYCSYLDKLNLFKYAPYDETIFIDADSLVMGDTNILWDDFEKTGDFSCYGRPLPLDSQEGWFYYKDLNELQEKITFCVSMHGGLYYLRKSDKCRQIFEDALNFAENYHDYTFAYFKEPADEPVLALSMAINNCRPCSEKDRIIFIPSYDGAVSVNSKKAIKVCGHIKTPVILHFGNRNLPSFLYQYQSAYINHTISNPEEAFPKNKRFRIMLNCLPFEMKSFAKRIIKRLLPASTIQYIKKFFRR